MKEQFSLAASRDVLQLLDTAADKVGLSRGQTFDDFLTFVLCSLAGQTMEEEYLATVSKGYAEGEEGRRGIDCLAKAFGALVKAMEATQQDVLAGISHLAVFRSPTHTVRLILNPNCEVRRPSLNAFDVSHRRVVANCRSRPRTMPPWREGVLA